MMQTGKYVHQTRVADAIFVGFQQYDSIMSGKHGTETWHDEEHVIYTNGTRSMGGPSLWGILGRPLGDGCRVRVTVEVLSEGDPVKTTNPWKEKQKR